MTAAMKNTIADTYLALLEHKSIDKVTVKDLVEACGISRQTFYYHFKDIIEVIEWMVHRTCDQLLAESLKQPTAAKAIGVYVHLVVEKRELIRRGLASSKRDYIEKALFLSLQKYLQSLFRAAHPSLPVNNTTEQLALQFCTGGLSGVLLVYCQSQTVNIEELLDQVASFLNAIETVVRNSS